MANWVISGTTTPHPTLNDYQGTFTTPAKLAEFIAITTSVADNQFRYESSLTGVSLPQATTIGDFAFNTSKLTSLSLPQATTIGEYAFGSSLITSLSLPQATTIGAGAFIGTPITSLSLPQATTIGRSAFGNSPITSLSLPQATTIGTNAFSKSTLTSLSLPQATTIGDFAFSKSTLTSLSLPQATTITWRAFSSIVNSPSTTVIMKSKFNNDSDKNDMFVAGNWNNITFSWVPDGAYIGYNGHYLSKPFPYKGKKVVKISVGSKTIAFPVKYIAKDNGLYDGTTRLSYNKAIVGSSGGNNNVYQQKVWGLGPLDLKYVKDVGQSFSSAYQVTEALDIGNKAVFNIAAYYTSDNYQTTTKPANYHITVSKGTGGAIVSEGHTIANGSNANVWTHDFGGSWAKVWVKNENGKASIRFGAGSGHSQPSATVIKSVDITY